MNSWVILPIVAAFAAGLLSAWCVRQFGQRRDQAGHDSTVAGTEPVDGEVRRTTGDDEAGEANGEKARLSESATAESLLGSSSVAMIGLAGVVVLGSIGLYVAIADLDAPSTLPAPSTSGSSAVEQLAALAGRQDLAAEPAQGQATLPSVDEMIERLVARLRQSPNDPDGWRMLGWSYFHTEHFAESAAAYRKAVDLRPERAEFRTLRGEALVRAADGRVTAEAMQDFSEALRLDPSDLRARYFKGLAKEQAGDKKSALADWTAILSDADPNEPWLPDLKQRTAQLAQEIGVDTSLQVSGRQAAPAGGVWTSLRDWERAPDPGAGRKGPTAEDVRAGEAMPPADRAAMIGGMVDGLAKRLEQSPRDSEGWIKLVRSRIVLGQTEEAKRALDRALAIFSDAPQQRNQIAAAAQELGLLP